MQVPLIVFLSEFGKQVHILILQQTGWGRYWNPSSIQDKSLRDVAVFGAWLNLVNKRILSPSPPPPLVLGVGRAHSDPV